MSEHEGQRIGNYHLHRLLGKGASAEVYLGEHLYLRNTAAIKILHTSLTETNEQLFLTEAQTVAQLTHPNIVRVREFAIERSTPFLAMDYAPGGSLRHRYPKGTCLSIEKTVSYAKQIAAALQYAHNRGIIHRDVKPENVLQGSEQVMLSDFGISVHSPKPDTINSQQWAGTLPYMAPEQFRGHAVFASDQYALAILVYEWLCGVRPFEGTSASLAYQHAHLPPPGLREKDPSLPESVEMVILKALFKKPEDRYVSMANFSRALERASRDTNDKLLADIATELPDTPRLAISRRVFLSHASSDDITHLHADLTTRDISVQDGADTETQKEQMRQAIRAAQVVVLVLTPQTRTSAVVKEHLHIANLYRRRIICVWEQGDDLHDLLPIGAEQATIIDAHDQKQDKIINEVIACFEQEYRDIANNETRLPELNFEPRNPYKGLLAFTQDDRADFFGRTSVVEELLALLKKMIRSAPAEGPEARSLAIVGPSGSGKSSVVMAGLIPKLQDGALPGSEEWVYLNPIVPGKQPLEALVQLLTAHFPEKDPQVAREILSKDGGFGLHELALTLVSHPETRMVLTIDQFEELFSPAIPEQERLHFIHLLVTATTEPHGPVVILFTLRADFYDRPLAYPTLGRLIQQHQCLVLPMSVEDLREVIERPALLPDVRLIFEEDLVNDLLFDMRGQMGALPLLEFALEQLFQRRRERRLTRRAYQEIGGIRGALSQQAESTYQALPSQEHRRLAHTLFIRLVQFGSQGQEPLRRRAALSEFDLAKASEKQQMHETLEAFINARLLMTNQSSGTTTVEISHEAVLREWKRLTEWLHEASEDIHFQQSLSEDVAEWNQRKRPQDRLYRGIQLKEARDWAKRNKTNEQETAFLRASVTRSIFSLVSLILVALLLVSLTGVAGWYWFLQPQPTLVTTLQDNGTGSLRWCVDNAPTGSTIRFEPGMSGIIQLTEGLTFQGGKKLTIVGPGAKQLAISGGNLNAGIYVSQKATLNISGLSFKDSQTVVNAFLFNEGTLTMTESIISNNRNVHVAVSTVSAFGGGISNSSTGTLILTKSLVSNNTVSSIYANGIGGGIFNEGSLTITDSVVSNNTANSTKQEGIGGGIDNFGTLTITNSSFSHNTASSTSNYGIGGGISNRTAGKLTLTNSSLSNNTASSTSNYGIGGGISNQGTLTMTNSPLSNNTASSTSSVGIGGGIDNEGTLTMTNSTLSNNMANSASSSGIGGGITDEQNSTVLVEASTFSNNSASGDKDSQGGGIANDGKLTVVNSTFVKNAVLGNNGLIGSGGSIANENDGIVLISFSTLYQNTSGSGGGIWNNPTKNGQMTMSGTIVTENSAQDSPDIAGTLISKGYNLIENVTGTHGLSDTDKQVAFTDLKLDSTLSKNGGPTQTLKLLPTSPAIDVIPLQACHITVTDASGNPMTISTDQRGDPRPDASENMCDIGAYESAY